MSQMHAPVIPVGTQTWLAPGSQNGPHVTPVSQTGQQPSVTAVSVLWGIFFPPIYCVSIIIFFSLSSLVVLMNFKF